MDESEKSQPLRAGTIGAAITTIPFAVMSAASLYLASRTINTNEKLLADMRQCNATIEDMVESAKKDATQWNELSDKASELAVACEDMKKAKEETIALQNNKISLLEQVDGLRTKGLAAHYPELTLNADAGLTREERAEISMALQRQAATPDEANLCVYVRHYVVETTPKYSSNGTCVFVSPTLLLTNYHVVGHDEPEDLFYFTSDFIHTLGGQYSIKDIVAISPRYDIALVRTRTANTAAVPVAIAKAKGTSYSYMSLRPTEEGNLEVKTGSAKKVDRETTLGMNQFGVTYFPSLVIDANTVPGYSGSPVFANGALIGLVAQSQGSDNKTRVTDHVYDFMAKVADN